MKKTAFNVFKAFVNIAFWYIMIDGFIKLFF